jgi:hypothetical protein
MFWKCHVGHKIAMRVLVLVISVLGLAAVNHVGFAAEQSPFYQGKVVRVVVGTRRVEALMFMRARSPVIGASTFPVTRKSSLRTSPGRRLWSRPNTFFRRGPTG